MAFRLRPGDGQGPQAYLDRQPYFQQMPRLLVYETAIHWIDTFRFLMGEVSAVYARLRTVNPVIAGEDAGYIVFEFDSGATGLFDGNRLNDHAARQPAPDHGRDVAGRQRRRAAARRRGAPVVEAASRRRDRAQLRPGPDDRFGGGACEWMQTRMSSTHLRHGAPLEKTARDYLRQSHDRRKRSIARTRKAADRD